MVDLGGEKVISEFGLTVIRIVNPTGLSAPSAIWDRAKVTYFLVQIDRIQNVSLPNAQFLTNQNGKQLKIQDSHQILWPVQHLSLRKLTQRKENAVVY